MKTRIYKLKAKQSLAENRALYQYFFIPIAVALALLILGQFRPEIDLRQIIIQTEPGDLLKSELLSNLFPTTLSLILGILGISTSKHLLAILKHPSKPVDWRQPLEAFSSLNLPRFLAFSLGKTALLTLWALPAIAGSLMASYQSFVILHIYLPKTDDFGQLITPLTTSETVVVNNASQFLLIAIALIILGLMIYLPQYYAYSQADYIYSSQVSDKETPRLSTILKASRFLMKRRRWERFKLDISFLPWYIFNAFCLGALQFYLIPYTQVTFAHFYLELLERNRKR